MKLYSSSLIGCIGEGVDDHPLGSLVAVWLNEPQNYGAGDSLTLGASVRACELGRWWLGAFWGRVIAGF